MQEKTHTLTRELAERQAQRTAGRMKGKKAFRFKNEKQIGPSLPEKGTKGRKDKRATPIKFEDGSHALDTDEYNAMHRRTPRPGRSAK